MKIFDSVEALEAALGTEVAVSEWATMTQDRVNLFAQATDDPQWIHVDVERATQQSPFGGTVAHGYLTLSLLPKFLESTIDVRFCHMSINYGANKIRFTAPVKAGDRIRMKRSLLQFEDLDKSMRLTFGNTIEIEGSERPALYAETISLIFK